MFRSILTAGVLTILGSVVGCSPKTSEHELLNVSYDPTRELYAAINPAFVKDQASKGKQVSVNTVHGGSGAQAGSVINGQKADVVTLALGGDIDAIARTGIINPDWQKRLESNSSPYTSTIVFVVRDGNPKNIRDWDDLVRDDVKVITPDPKTSGGARWNFLAAWGYVTLHKKKGDNEATEFVTRLYQNVLKLDTGARGSTDTFIKGKQGDVFLSWENEAFLVKKLSKEKLQIVYPSVSILAEPPVAVVDRVVDEKKTRALAEAYLQFLYTDAAQEIIAAHGYRPINAEIRKKHAKAEADIPLFTLKDVVGSWDQANERFFADRAIFDQIYRKKGS